MQSLKSFSKVGAVMTILSLLMLVTGSPEAVAKSNKRDRSRSIPLTVVVKGGGTVTSQPKGLSCSAGVCKAEFPRGTVVRLYADPEEGQFLSRWRGACGGSKRCKVRLKRPRRVFASFKTPKPIPLMVYVKGGGKVTSKPEGISCDGGRCRGEFPRGTVVKLYAKPDEGQYLAGWRGACGGKKRCKIKMKRPRRVLAVFKKPRPIPLAVMVRGDGIVSSTPDGLKCDEGICVKRFPRGSVVTLTATPKEGHSFSHWRGACRGSKSCKVKMKWRRKVLAMFKPVDPPDNMALSVTLKGEGKVSSKPDGLSCEKTLCKGEFPKGTKVFLTPMPSEGHKFAEWGGGCKGTEECTVTLEEPISVTAAFESAAPPNVTLTVTYTGEGKIVSKPDGLECEKGTCTGEFEQGTVVMLTPMPGDDLVFGEWKGACTGSEGCTITLNAATTVMASFVPPPPPPNVNVTVSIVGDGSVISSPTGIDCPTGDCTAQFQSGTLLTLSATPNAGQQFSGWSGDCTGATCSVTLSAAISVTATFIAVTPGSMSDAEAIRFLEQSTWGPTPASIAHLKSVGKDAFLNEQFAAVPSTYPDPVDDSSSLGPLQDAFFFNAFHGQDQLRQRVAFALSQLFVVSANAVGRDDQMIPYQRIFLGNAFGNFRFLIEAVTVSPTMGKFLDMVNNDKTEPGSGLNPNENYARELLQLFSVGTTVLNIDGSDQLVNGQPVQPYDQAVIDNLSRVFTGWTYPVRSGNQSKWRNPEHFDGPMEAFDDHHDMGTKVLMNGFTIPGGQSAQVDLAAALDHIFAHPNVGPFVATRLIRNLVTSNPSPAYISRVATVFNANQNGVRGNLESVVRAILLDPEAMTVVANGGHLREPILFGIALLRSLNADVQLDNPLYSRIRDMGQSLFSPPSVFNYFSPLYRIPGTSLFGPEYQIHTLSSAIARANFVDRVVDNNLGGGVSIDLAPFIAVASDDGQLITLVEQTLLHDNLSVAERGRIIAALSNASSNLTTRARLVLYLVATSARYQVQH